MKARWTQHKHGSQQHVPVTATGRQCGFPGRPRNGTSSTAAPVSRPGDTAHYTCRPGYTLFGEEERVCLDSGIWAGRQPLCGEYSLHDMLTEFSIGDVMCSDGF
jgi:hypothetical protein